MRECGNDGDNEKMKEDTKRKKEQESNKKWEREGEINRGRKTDRYT